MTVHHLESEKSDDESDAEDMVSLPPVDIYRRKYQLLLERCEVLQQDNERLINRLHASSRTTRRFKMDIQLLAERLDSHGDPFRSVPIIEHYNVKPPLAIKTQATTKQADKQNATGGKKQATKRKCKGDRPEKDPNAPKKPCNAFFQFCQEQRPIVIAETNHEGIEPTKQEVTRQLAHRWRSLSNEEKRVYVAMFEKSKEKYVEQMSQYNIIKKENDTQLMTV